MLPIGTSHRPSYALVRAKPLVHVMKHPGFTAAVVLSIALVISAGMVSIAIVILAASMQMSSVPSTPNQLRKSSILSTNPFSVRDIGPRLHQIGRPTVWQAQYLPLGNTGFLASVGPGRTGNRTVSTLHSVIRKNHW